MNIRILVVPVSLAVMGMMVWAVEKNCPAGNQTAAVTTSADNGAAMQSPPESAASTSAIATKEVPDRASNRESSPVAETSPAPSTYTAQAGDTVSDLAATLPGGDRKANRDAVINANQSLQHNPDLVLEGKTYQIPQQQGSPVGATPGNGTVASTPMPAQAASPVGSSSLFPTPKGTPIEAVHELKYTARAGDTVSVLAGALLGGDTKENRDTIIAANGTLQDNPDRLLNQQTYLIPVHASQPLAAAPIESTPVLPRPAIQPDADTVVLAGSARELRYIAHEGDNISTLAIALLGRDTKENRNVVIQNNESLKQNPDLVLAGQTYWITAPTAR